VRDEDFKPRLDIDGGRRSRGQFVRQCQQFLDENPDADLEHRASAAVVVATNGRRKGGPPVNWGQVAELAGATPEECEAALMEMHARKGMT
jgi:hypothetical protein